MAETPAERWKRMQEARASVISGPIWSKGDLAWALRVCGAAIEAHEDGQLQGAVIRKPSRHRIRALLEAIKDRDA